MHASFSSLSVSLVLRSSLFFFLFSHVLQTPRRPVNTHTHVAGAAKHTVWFLLKDGAFHHSDCSSLYSQSIIWDNIPVESQRWTGVRGVRRWPNFICSNSCNFYLLAVMWWNLEGYDWTTTRTERLQQPVSRFLRTFLSVKGSDTRRWGFPICYIMKHCRRSVTFVSLSLFPCNTCQSKSV